MIFNFLKFIFSGQKQIRELQESMTRSHINIVSLANSVSVLHQRIEDLRAKANQQGETLVPNVDAENLKIAQAKVKGPGLRVLMPQRARKPGEEH